MTNSDNHPGTVQRIQNALLDVVANVPSTSCSVSTDPKREADSLAFKAKTQAAVVAGGLALPPGPLGLLTILPDLIIIWKIQAQLVSDIAALYGKTSTLKQEAMLYCLFKYGAASLGRDLVIRVGERYLLRRASARFIQKILAELGVRIGQRVVVKGLARWLIIIGAVAVGGYAYYDTGKVAENAIDLFSRDIDIEDGDVDEPEPQ